MAGNPIDGFTDALSNGWKSIKDGVDGVTDFVGSIRTKMENAFNSFKNNVANLFNNAGITLSNGFNSIANAAESFTSSVGSSVTGLFSGIKNRTAINVGSAAGGIIATIKSVPETIFGTIKSWFSTAWAALKRRL